MSLIFANFIHAIGRFRSGALVAGSNGIVSVADPGTGIYTITLSDPIADNDCIVIPTVAGATSAFAAYNWASTTTITLLLRDAAGAGTTGQWDITVLRLK